MGEILFGIGFFGAWVFGLYASVNIFFQFDKLEKESLTGRKQTSGKILSLLFGLFFVLVIVFFVNVVFIA